MENLTVTEKANALLCQGLPWAKVDKVVDNLLRNTTTAAKTRVAADKPTLQAWMKLCRSRGCKMKLQVWEGASMDVGLFFLWLLDCE